MACYLEENSEWNDHVYMSSQKLWRPEDSGTSPLKS